MAKSRRPKSTVFDTITVEGSLLSSAMLTQIAERKAGNQAEADYLVPKGLKLRDEIARYYRIAEALFKDLNAGPHPSVETTIAFIESFTRDVLGFSETAPHTGEGVALQAKSGRVPVVVVPPADELDRASPSLSAEGRRRSAATALQDWLNQHENSLWGLCSNGDRLRLMRRNPSLTRPAYIEVNLRQIFESENFADFSAAWLILDATRFGAADAQPADCQLERWREAGAKEGLVVRDRLRDGVESALFALGNGFLAHKDNGKLRARLASGELTLNSFFGELLRLVYRMIFLLVAEDRNLLHPPDTEPALRKLYADGYSLSALRERAVRRAAWDDHHDRWEGLLITFRALADGQPKLGIPALGGLFENNIPDLETARLRNKSFMEAVYRLAWLKDEFSLLPVNWRDMETEELGSVYESLFELIPLLVDDGHGFTFAEGAETKGNQRKTTGSYYTPDSLVQTLLDSALDPVLDRVESESSDRAQALLNVSVVDPACGSGHFLLGAARRIATRLARARTGGVASATDYRHALRDVVRSCIHGVDRNPMAVELSKVALWIETVEPGKPLGFLDANILLGDSLLGVFDLEVLRKGIPDAAYKPLMGDDRTVCRDYDRRNKAERDTGQSTFDFSGRRAVLPSPPPLAAPIHAIKSLPEDSPEQIVEKKKRLAAAKRDKLLWNWREAADLYVAAFLLPKKETPREPSESLVPTTDHVWKKLSGHQIYGPLIGVVIETTQLARIFHWPIEFPDVMANGGFDAVIGNPPWERIKVQEQEFFASRAPEIAAAATASIRGKMIEQLSNARDDPHKLRIYEEFEVAKRIAEAASVFFRESGRFPKTGVGDINTYALFSELFGDLPKEQGRAGIIVPTGIATDATTADFFGLLLREQRLISLYDFQTGLGFFDRIGHARFKFCLLTTSRSGSGPSRIPFSFFSRTAEEFADKRRHFTLSPDEIRKLNPNTGTAPILRTKYDAELTAKLYNNVPVLIKDGQEGGNPWGISFMRMFDMATDSDLFHTELGPERVALLEAKMTHQFDHRWCTYQNGETRDLTSAEKADPSFEPTSRYWIDVNEVQKRLAERNWPHKWLLGWRDICRATDERTLIASVVPIQGVGDKFLLMFPKSPASTIIGLYGCLNSIVCDYAARQKLGGTSLKYYTIKQLPVLPPTAFKDSDLSTLAKRICELVLSSSSLTSFGIDLKCQDKVYPWNEARRAQLRAELDAWYAHAYGLNRDELRYILDPADVMGEDYPSETFRVLQKNELRKYGEYRTRRLVLEAWDRLEVGDLK